MKLVFATHNQNKLIEVQELLPPSIELLSLTDIGCHDEIAETATTIEGNAQLKAAYVREHYHLNCFADDTGLEVTALNGAPGVYSARYAGPEKDAKANMKKLLEALADKQDRSAQFKTVIAFASDSCASAEASSDTWTEMTFTGICAGEIIKEPRGEKGFGYDPIFQPQGYDQTFAEISSEEKGKIGHRGKAMRKLIQYLENHS